MTTVRLNAIGRATPSATYSQQDLLDLSPWQPSALLDKLFLESAVHTRGFMVPPSFFLEQGQATGRTLTQTNAAWLDGAMALGSAAVADALDRAAWAPESVDQFSVTTVTGYATPGLDLLLAREHSFRSNIARAHFNCIGCHAALPLLKVAVDHVAHHPTERALSLAVEVCSAAFRTDETPQNQVATSLFADGAAVAAVSTTGDGPSIIGFGSRYDYAHIDALGFGLDSLGFSIVLDPSIPSIIARHIQGTVDDLLQEHGLARADVVRWAFHPGGSRILDGVQAALELSDADLLPSRRVLRAHGNMSSPSVLFSFAECMRLYGVPESGVGVLAAFGPGLGIEVALVAFGR